MTFQDERELDVLDSGLFQRAEPISMFFVAFDALLDALRDGSHFVEKMFPGCILVLVEKRSNGSTETQPLYTITVGKPDAESAAFAQEAIV